MRPETRDWDGDSSGDWVEIDRVTRAYLAKAIVELAGELEVGLATSAPR